ncbi:MAG: DUF1588 domain-containing protein [Puniceicoccaceae bacterium]
MRLVTKAIYGLLPRLPRIASVLVFFLGYVYTSAAESEDPPALETMPMAALEFLDNYCLNCHDSFEKKGGFDMEILGFDLASAHGFKQWVKVFDRAREGEMPPKNRRQPGAKELGQFLEAIGQEMESADSARIARNGRAKTRRLNRFEYENTLRQILDADWLQVADRLPEDSTAHLFNKVGEMLDVSHVQIQQYLKASDFALRAAKDQAAHPAKTERFYAREEPIMQNYLNYRDGQRAATRAITPLIGTTPQPEVIRGNEPVTVGDANPEMREMEAFGTVSGTYTATTKYDFTRMDPPVDGRYRLRMKTYTYTAGPNGASGGPDHGITGGNVAWWRPSRSEAFPGKRSEPVTLYALADSGDSRWLTTFDSFPEPSVIERIVDLKAGEGIRPDAARLVRTRPGWKGNPNATPEGIPGFALQWLEVEGPINEEWPPASYKALFGDLPFEVDDAGSVRAISEAENRDSRRLLVRFWERATGERSGSKGSKPYLDIYKQARELGMDFTDSMTTAYSAILCSPEFLFFDPKPGTLDNADLADRLAYFLWNGPPDEALASEQQLTRNSERQRHAVRLLEHPNSNRFVDAFLDYWLDLRDIKANAPDAALYPEYYLDDLLTESSVLETRLFFRELIDGDLPVRNLVQADFAYVNERLAQLYELPTFEGVHLRRVSLPEGHPRGGLLTQASVLRVTANGTTTSPVLRGAWAMERIVGIEIPPPPSGVEAVEPDIRGATTIREQLEKHTTIASCYSCHAKFDPVGLAMENFDVVGGWRDQYRAVGDDGEPIEGFGKNGHSFVYWPAQPVDSSGEMEDGTPFSSIHDLKDILAADDRQLARNLVNRFIVYATGAPVSFSEREEVERILDTAQTNDYGVRSLLLEVINSEIFKIK